MQIAGNAIGDTNERVRRRWLETVSAVCNDTCPHWVKKRGCNGGCGLSPTKPCDIGYYHRKGYGCFADPPRFPPLRKIACVVPKNAAWTGPARGELFAGVLREAGHLVDVVPVASNRQADVEAFAGYDLVCVHAMQVEPKLIEQAAKQYPQTKFVVINHSAIAHLERLGDRYVSIFADCLRLAKERPNVWYASQEPIAESLKDSAGINRSMWLPSSGVEIRPRTFRPVGDPVTVIIGGRLDSIKNNLNQIIACRLSRHRVRLVLCVPRSPSLAAVIEQLGIDHEWRDYLPHDEWLHFLATEADMVLCCSLAESFGFVAAEAMASGVPIIASDAIRFADPRLLANHADAADVASTIDEAIDDYESCCERAAELGQATIQRQRREYVQRIERLLNTDDYD